MNLKIGDIFENMKPIVEYTDYRKVVQDYYEDCKRRSSFTWREFAEKAGFASAIYLKYVGEGKKNLSASGATQTARAMGLDGFELAYFELLVAYAHAKDAESKKSVFAKICALADEHRVKIAGKEDFEFFSSWKNIVLREIVPAMPGAKPLEVAKACKPAITAAEVTEILNFLVKAGLLKKDSEGAYRQTDRALFMDTFGVKDLVAKDLQVQMGELAVNAIKNMPKEERSMSGLTLGLTERSRERIEREIVEFRRRIVAIATEDEETEQVFRLNLQLFPLCEKLRRRNENEKDAQ